VTYLFGYADRVRVGDITVDPVVDGAGWIGVEFLIKPSANAVTDPWPSAHPYLDDQRRMELTMGGFLVRTADRVVLIDTGFGPANLGPIKCGSFLTRLANYGVQPGDVTDVVLTHLHQDHIGWCSQNGVAVFPNATYRCHADDWAHFITDGHIEERTLPALLPIESQLEPFDGDIAIAPGLTVRHAPGHTPGSTIVVLSSGTARAMLIGDIAHCPAELTNDEWEMTFDVDPVMATATRNALARELEGSNTSVAAAHFSGLAFGRILSGQGRRLWSV
jgi:glyoxylase-like metal-dependent hydrolase (beta-lactamase superfamily II)